MLSVDVGCRLLEGFDVRTQRSLEKDGLLEPALLQLSHDGFDGPGSEW
jgi:hypothetical protein